MHTIPHIDYQKIVEAKKFYEASGFIEMSVPWIVSYEAYAGTKPDASQDFFTYGGYLSASGEQGFMQCMLQGKSIGRNYCITPCFRLEPEFDDTHYMYFLKFELIETNVSKQNLMAMVRIAEEFFKKYTDIVVIQTDDSGMAFDILDKNTSVELGSYGIRTWKSFSWIYGTGVALPRLDVVLKKKHV